MVGVIDVGGGLRGIYGAGIFDYCMDHHIQFDYCSGVSAGSANTISYLAGQRGRNYTFYTDYTFRKEYMSFSNFIRKGSYLDLEYIYGTLTNEGGENPLDYDAIMKNPAQYRVVCTNAKTGDPVYFSKADIEKNNYGIIKGSSCVPIVDKPYTYHGVEYFDGGLSDPIPIEKAFEDGCDKVVVILTKPIDYYRDSKEDVRFSKLLRRKYPKSAQKLASRGLLYNQQLDVCKKYQKMGKVKIIAPKSVDGLNTLTKDKEKLIHLYNMAYFDAEQIESFL